MEKVNDKNQKKVKFGIWGFILGSIGVAIAACAILPKIQKKLGNMLYRQMD